MLVLNIIQFGIHIANCFGIFVLIGLTPSRGSPNWKMSNEVYKSILVLYSFLSMIRLFAFCWIISLIWRLRKICQADSLSISIENKNDFYNKEFESNETESKFLLIFLIFR